MNERIKKLAEQAGFSFKYKTAPNELNPGHKLQDLERFAELIVAKVLDEVAERAYYSGDRAWCDELDRRWVELEFGIGELAELKND